jgi:hypothetical protein
VLSDLYRQTIDVTATVGAGQDDPHLPYDVRVIGVRHEDDEDAPAYRDDVDADHEYHLYATNLPRGVFAPRELAALYSNRWSVETVIQELKEVFGLEEIPVRREAAVTFPAGTTADAVAEPVSVAAGASTARTRRAGLR